MRRSHRATVGWIAALAAAVTLFTAAPAAAVQVTTGTGSGIAGQTVDITIGTGNLTGLGIQSFQFSLSYNANLVTATDVIEAGTAVGNAGWGDATFGVTSGKISVSHAGTAALTGSGPLVIIRFLINPAQLSATSTALTLSNFTFNEGVPNDTTGNGSITINATPIITVSPNTGELVRTQTLAFSVSGSVTQPVTWFTTDPSVATIAGTGPLAATLTGVGPGSVRVFAVDNAGRRDTTDGDILVRGMSLAAGAVVTPVGQVATLPITVSSLSGLGIRAGQFKLTYSGTVLTATGVTTPPGTLLNGWGPATLGQSSGTCTVDFAGPSDLSGSGTLCYVTFATPASGFAGITVSNALFNEIYPAKTTNGSVNVTALPTITVSPDDVTLLAGQTQQFTVSGSATLPIAWSTLDPSIASITSGGLLTALSGGVTKVQAVDAIGATDLTTAVRVYDFRATCATVAAPPGATVRVPIRVDRDVSGLGIRSLQYVLTYNSTHILQARSLGTGLVSVWGTGRVTNQSPGRLVIAEAGSAALGTGSSDLEVLEFDLSPSVPVGTNLPITVTGFTCNEGLPLPQVVNGMIQVRTTADVTAGGDAALSFALPEPNPASGSLRLRWTLPEGGGGAASLAVFGVDGARVRTLSERSAGAGEHELSWDLRDAAGRRVPAGLYFAALDWQGRRLTRRVVVLP